MTTFNRGKLRKLVEKGKVEMVSGYHFDDQYGESRTEKVLPVAMKPEKWQDQKEGTCYLSSHDLAAKSGCCYESGKDQNGNLLVTLIVHSNCNYTFRIKE